MKNQFKNYSFKFLICVMVLFAVGCSNSSKTSSSLNNSETLAVTGVIEGTVAVNQDTLGAQQAASSQSGIAELCELAGDGKEECNDHVVEVINNAYTFENVDLSKVYTVSYKESQESRVLVRSLVHNPENKEKVSIISDAKSDLLTKFILNEIEDQEIAEQLDHKALDAIVSVVRAVVTKIVAEELTIDNVESTLITLKNQSEIQQAETDFIVSRLEKEIEPSKLIDDESAPLSNSEDAGITRYLKSKNGSVKVEKVLDEAGILIKEKIIHTKESGEKFQIEKNYREGEIITKSLKDDEVINVVIEKTKFEFKNQQYTRTDEYVSETIIVKQQILEQFQGEENVLEETELRLNFIDGESVLKLEAEKKYLLNKEDGLYRWDNDKWTKTFTYPLKGNVQVLGYLESMTYNSSKVNYLNTYVDSDGTEFEDVFKISILDPGYGFIYDMFMSRTGIRLNYGQIKIEADIFDRYIQEYNIDIDALIQEDLEFEYHYHDNEEGDTDTEDSNNQEENAVNIPTTFEFKNQQYVVRNVEDNGTTYVKQRIRSEFQGEENVLEETELRLNFIDGEPVPKLEAEKIYLLNKEDGLYSWDNDKWTKTFTYPLKGNVQVLGDLENMTYYSLKVNYLNIYVDSYGIEFEDVFKISLLNPDNGQYDDSFLSRTGISLNQGQVKIEADIFDRYIQEYNIDIDALIQEDLELEYHHHDNEEGDTDTEGSDTEDSNNQEENAVNIPTTFEFKNQQYVIRNVEDNETQYVKQRIRSEFQGEVNVLEEITIDRNSKGQLYVDKIYSVNKEDGLYKFINGEWVKTFSYPLVGEVKVLSGNEFGEMFYLDVVGSYLPSYRDQRGNEFQDVFNLNVFIPELSQNVDFYISKTGVPIMGQTEMKESVFDEFVAENNIDLNVNQNSSISASSVKTKNNSSSLALFRFSAN